MLVKEFVSMSEHIFAHTFGHLCLSEHLCLIECLSKCLCLNEHLSKHLCERLYLNDFLS